jgi:hypothetical protein
VSRTQQNDFTKGDESASREEPAPDPRQPPPKGEAEDLEARVLLHRAPPLAVNPQTATDGGTGSSSYEPNPGFMRPSSTMRSWRTCRPGLVPQPETQQRYIAVPGQADNASSNREETKQPALKGSTYPNPHQRLRARRDGTRKDGVGGRILGWEQATDIARALRRASADAAGERTPRNSVITKATTGHSRRASKMRPDGKAPEPGRRH